MAQTQETKEVHDIRDMIKFMGVHGLNKFISSAGKTGLVSILFRADELEVVDITEGIKGFKIYFSAVL